jgi:uncharacterized LabA/DUF88 family protein
MRRVAVFIDWQNTYHCAREAFHANGDPPRYGTIDPKSLAGLLTEKGDPGDRLVHVGVYRGAPDARKDPHTNAAFLRQLQAWKDSYGELLRPRTRPLRYLFGRPLSDAEEKGIDVQFAIDAMVMALNDEYDLAILVTADTDLLPVAEGLIALKTKAGKPDVAVVGWARTSQHLEVAGVPVRWVGPRDYEAVRDHRDYNVSAVDRRAGRA